MSNVMFEVHDELFIEWLDTIKNSFVHMTETMIRVAEMVKEEVQTSTVPIRTGRLSRSFKWTILTDNSRMKVLEIRMSALNPNTGYDYAWIQHENFSYNHSSSDLGFKTYTYEGKGKYSTFPSDIHIWEFHHGYPRYLAKGVNYVKSSAFEVIEEDYLSLFNGGFVV